MGLAHNACFFSLKKNQGMTHFFHVFCFFNSASILHEILHVTIPSLLLDTPQNATSGSTPAIVAHSSAHVFKRTKVDPYSTIRSYIHPHHKRKHIHHVRSHRMTKRHHRHRHGLHYPVKDKVEYYRRGSSKGVPKARNMYNNAAAGADHGDFEVNNGEVFEHGAVPDLSI